MTPLKTLLPLLCFLTSACISLPDIEDPLPEEPSTDGGFQGDGGPTTGGGSDGGSSDGGIDQTPPTLVRTSPPNGATHVPLDSTVELEFSEEMTVSTLRLSSVPPVSFNLASWMPDSRRAVFSASSPFGQDQQYTVTVEGKDLAGNSLAGNASFAFTTEGPAPDVTPPTLVGSSPSDLASAVPRDAIIKLTFSEPMNRASVERAFSITNPEGTSLGATTWNASGTEVEFTLGALLPYGTTVVWILSAEATDLAGNAADITSRSFRIIRLSIHTITASSSDSSMASAEPIIETTPWLIGDDSANRPYHGFASFSLYPLVTARVTQILSATLTWNYVNPGTGPFSSLGRFVVDPVYYGTFADDAFFSPSIGTPLFLGYQDLGVTSGTTNIPVTAMVVDAWNQRASRNNRAQFRLKFESWTDNDSTPDSLEINPDHLSLKITCEEP
jgi:hypothetical protein